MKYALEIQKELFSVISDLGYIVRDAFPSDIYPLFIVIGDDYGAQRPLKTEYAGEIINNIRIYSTYNGTYEIKKAMEDIIDSIDSLTISGRSIYFHEVMYSSILPYISERSYREGLLQIRWKLI
jgi:hypothetical protein